MSQFFANPMKAWALGLLAVLVAAPVSASKPPSGSLESLEVGLREAYRDFGEAFAGEGLALDAVVTSDVLAVRDHHFRVDQRLRPEFDGFYLADHDSAKPGLRFVEGEHFLALHYEPSAPLKEMVSVAVQGVFRGRPLYYEAFVFRYEWSPGDCSLRLMDPVFPSVEQFVSDAVLVELFPGCDSPETGRRLLLHSTEPEIKPSGEEGDDSEGPSVEACPGEREGDCVGTRSADGKCEPRVEPVCNTWHGYQNWVYGGEWEMKITCKETADGCGYKSFTSKAQLQSSIESKGNSSWECMKLGFGGDTTGGMGTKVLKRGGRSVGGHDKLRMELLVVRHVESASTTSLSLGGQCAGNLDLGGDHGSGADAEGHIDWTETRETRLGQFKVDSFPVSGDIDFECGDGGAPPRPERPEVKPIRYRVIEPFPL